MLTGQAECWIIKTCESHKRVALKGMGPRRNTSRTVAPDVLQLGEMLEEGVSEGFF